MFRKCFRSFTCPILIFPNTATTSDNLLSQFDLIGNEGAWEGGGGVNLPPLSIFLVNIFRFLQAND